MTDKSVHLLSLLLVDLYCLHFIQLTYCLPFPLASDEHWLEHSLIRLFYSVLVWRSTSMPKSVLFLCMCFFFAFFLFKFWYEVFIFGDLFYFVELFRNAVSDWFIWVLSHLFSRVDETFREIISDVGCIFQCVYLGMFECCFMYVCVISIPLNFII